MMVLGTELSQLQLSSETFQQHIFKGTSLALKAPYLRIFKGAQLLTPQWNSGVGDAVMRFILLFKLLMDVENAEDQLQLASASLV